MRGLDNWIEGWDAETECPECGATDPYDCPCRDCTVCHHHESECVCGTEEAEDEAAEAELLNTASWVYEATGADLDTCLNEAAKLLADLGDEEADDAL